MFEANENSQKKQRTNRIHTEKNINKNDIKSYDIPTEKYKTHRRIIRRKLL
jgi:hypothetical protein